MVIDDNGPVGLVNWRPRRQSIRGTHCWVIGIGLLPEARGHGYGAEAQRLLVRYLFANTTVHRVGTITEACNVTEQKALEKAGFTREA
jgi:RimJ/RimL family protein N-acetyltransferase